MRKINGFIIVFLCAVMQLNMIVCTEAPPSSEGCDPACFEDQICDVENNQCVVDSGDAAGPFIIAKRSAPCQPIICAIYCKFGNKQDSNGCDICDCQEQDQCPLMFCPGKCSRSRCINEKPGVCPKPFGAGICVELCSGDHSCPGAQKCCSNGCGRACMNPLPTGEKPGVCPQLKRSDECIRGCPSDASCSGSKKCCQRCCKQGGCGGVCVEPLVCEVNENWKGNFKMKKNVCKKCSCQEMFNKGGKFMKRACKKSKIFKNCCPLCQLVAKKG